MDKKSARPTARDFVKEKSDQAVTQRLEELTTGITKEGYEISFGVIGRKTTYCMLVKGDDEYVGFTFIRNIKYMNDKVGKLKALQQALARKEISESRAKEIAVTPNVEDSDK